MDYVDALKDIRVIAWAIGSFAAVIAFFVAWAVKAQMNISTLMNFKKQMLEKATPIMKPACLEAQEKCHESLNYRFQNLEEKDKSHEQQIASIIRAMEVNSDKADKRVSEAIEAGEKNTDRILRLLEGKIN